MYPSVACGSWLDGGAKTVLQLFYLLGFLILMSSEMQLVEKQSLFSIQDEISFQSWALTEMDISQGRRCLGTGILSLTADCQMELSTKFRKMFTIFWHIISSNYYAKEIRGKWVRLLIGWELWTSMYQLKHIWFGWKGHQIVPSNIVKTFAKFYWQL